MDRGGRRLAVAAVLCLALALVAVAGAGAGSVTVADEVGDARGGPDIAAVAIADDAHTGLISFTVSASGFDQQPAATIAVFLDTDQNPATGDGGPDYMLVDFVDSTGPGWDFMHWDGGKWVDATPGTKASFARNGDGFTWWVGTADIGSPPAFTWAVATYVGEGDSATIADTVPDTGTLDYEPAAPLTAVIGTPTATRLVPGKAASVRAIVTRSDTGDELLTAGVSSRVSVGGRAIARTEELARGVLRVAFVVPRNAKGKRVQVQMTVTFAGRTATRIASFRVG